MRGAQALAHDRAAVRPDSISDGRAGQGPVGFFRGATESFLMRMTDLFLTIPLLVTAAVVAATAAAVRWSWRSCSAC
jgi:hypothetical protein